MKAIVRTKAGKAFSTMEVQDLAPPSPQAGEVKIKMATSRVNPVDMDLMKGFPSLKYKIPQIGGVDGAGEIIALGEGVNDFQLGDQVFFYRMFTDIGSWAEEITIAASDIAKIPATIAAAEAGSIALPLLTAYEALQSLTPKRGESILIHGAGGGVGFQAVQLAKVMGLKVIANASKRDKDKLKAVGIDVFIDYRVDDFEVVLKDKIPNYIFDVIGKDTLARSIRLSPKKVVSVAFPDISKMWKTGVQLPWFLKTAMRLMNRRFIKLAKKNQVELIGQVTGANGAHLQAASKLISNTDYLISPIESITLDQVAKNGLSKSDLGKVLIFSS